MANQFSWRDFESLASARTKTTTRSDRGPRGKERDTTMDRETRRVFTSRCCLMLRHGQVAKLCKFNTGKGVGNVNKTSAKSRARSGTQAPLFCRPGGPCWPGPSRPLDRAREPAPNHLDFRSTTNLDHAGARAGKPDGLKLGGDERTNPTPAHPDWTERKEPTDIIEVIMLKSSMLT